MRHKKIGIIGGMSPVSTSDYYNEITDGYYNFKKDIFFPEIFVHSIPFGKIIKKNYKDTKLIVNSIKSLELAGADFVIAACNSIHINFREVTKKIKIPWLSITKPTIDYLIRKKIRRILLLGTKYTLNDNFFLNDLKDNNIEVTLPSKKESEKINKIIYKELVFKNVSRSSTNYLKKILKKYKKIGLNNIILACTELRYAFKDNNKFKEFNLIDTSSLHSKYALKYSINLI